MKQPSSHINRPANPLSQLGLQQPGNLSLGWSHPNSFGQQARPADDTSTSHREEAGTDYGKLDQNQLSGALGHHWDFGHFGHDQHPETGYPSAAALEYPGESSRLSMSDVPANRPDPEFDSTSHPDSAHWQAQLSGVLPDANQARTSLLGHSSQGARSSAFTSSQNRSNQEHSHQGQSAESRKNTHFDRTLFSTATYASSLVENPGDQKSHRRKRKITDVRLRRTEQNRAHQKAFRERRDVRQGETIRNLQAQLASVENWHSNQNPSSLPDYSRGHQHGNSLPPNNQSLPLLENLELEANRHLLLAIPNANHQSGSAPLQWNHSSSHYAPSRSIFDSNPPEGSTRNNHLHQNHQGPSTQR
ncbi:hypothetical protein, variant [Puccinia triticina 1-1 BBBD Race 1]|uniref:BZIP domain-containing protein n=1 Tax=Puccinia triticina (isolate 1-1 / race 1 (BBBD)) TaxID=630390 RepID=A0A180GIW8_PUCT1|nr:hypothetical protein, variant [Puccinia triticina 1-1 BBBD Race 1]